MDMLSSMEQHLPWGHNMRNRPRDSQKHWQWHDQTSETTQADPCLETAYKTNPLTYYWSGFLLLVTKSMLLEKAMATHSSTLAWKTPWMEEPGRLQSMGSQRVGHDWATWLSFSLSCIGEGNGNPLQCSCLENPRDGGAWWAAVYGVTQNWTWLKRLSSSSSSKSMLWQTLTISTLQLRKQAQIAQQTWPEVWYKSRSFWFQIIRFFPGFPESKERKFGLERWGSKFLARHLVLWNKMLLFQNPLQLALAIWLSLASEMQRRQWHPTPVLLPRKSHGQRSLVGCSPWVC